MLRAPQWMLRAPCWRLRAPQWTLRAPQWMLRAPQWMLRAWRTVFVFGALFSASAAIRGEGRVVRWRKVLLRGVLLRGPDATYVMCPAGSHERRAHDGLDHAARPGAGHRWQAPHPAQAQGAPHHAREALPGARRQAV
eukprot:4788753-Pyramimonas_sp.AAC.1